MRGVLGFTLAGALQFRWTHTYIYLLIDGQNFFHYLYEREPRDPQVFLNFFQSGIFIQKSIFVKLHSCFINSFLYGCLYKTMYIFFVSVSFLCHKWPRKFNLIFFFSSKIFQINFLSLCGGFSSLHKRFKLTATAHAPKLPISLFQWPGCSFQQNPARILRLLKNWKSNHSC